ncbi:hypothetical protein RUM43_002522 [Polyplax serrata]|uniref:C2H2-type domain-containing protein n=1 Tax=Polyplax serrata TaxID=468196 RepID=A0AAN8PG46_POLSC
MSSGNSKVTSKMKTTSGDLRTLKPILPKLNPVVTRVIEINAPAMQMCKCFVCDERVISSGVPLLQSTTQVSNTDLPTKIGQLMGEKFMVVVSADDVLCRKCHALVNHVDKLESDLLLVKRSLRNHLKKKYGLNDDIKETETVKVENEVEMEYTFVQDVESEEDHEPQSKKPKQSRPVRFRAIKPKPPGSVQLLKCPSCNFITTEPDLLSCHRVVCTAMAYKCTMCDKKFDSQKMIRNHKIEAHLTKWICHFCNISFNEEKKFTLHMKNHLGDRLNNKTVKIKTDEGKKEKVTLSFKCPHCPESFEAFSQLQIHLVNHTSSVTFRCVRCDIGFQNKLELIEHVKTHDEGTPEEYILPGSPEEGKETAETLYSCSECSINFIQEDLYLRHLSMHQEMEPVEQTEQSDMNLFPEEGEKNASKPEKEEFECPNCGEKKEDSETLEMHRLTECLGLEKKTVNEVKDVSESEYQENAGEEASHLELNQLLYVNSLNVQLVDGNVVFQNATDAKGEIENSENDANANSKSVEDILENMFQVKDEDSGKMGEEAEGEVPENELQVSDLKQGKNKTFMCAVCSFATQNLGALKKHFVEAHEAFKCWICKKDFQMEDLRKHLAEEHGTSTVSVQSKTYNCVHCSEKFTNRRALHLHEVKHPENLNIQCPDCGEKFARDKFLNEHREAAHTVAHCRVCNKSFGNVKQLKSHEARHAKSDKTQFKCTDCDRIFQTPTGLRHHKAIHTGEFKYKCEFCGKGFVARVRYEEHRASHTKEERYSCEICGKKFSFQATYWIHRKWHDNPTPYKCEYCGRLFKHSSLLSVHKRKHTGERPYECPHCDQSFTVGNTLKRHLMLHTGLFPFTCQICDQGFSGKHKMALHMSKVHQDNSLLEQQSQKKPSEYKMVVKQEPEKTETVTEETDQSQQNQTWILTENDNNRSQMLTIQTAEGENIPCTLLTDDIIGNIVNTDNRIVEIIPYDTIKAESVEDGNEVGFILMNQTDRSNLGMISEDETFIDQSQVFNGECLKKDEVETVIPQSTQMKHIVYSKGENGPQETNVESSENMVQGFAS